MSQINAVTIGKLIEAHREGDEQMVQYVRRYDQTRNQKRHGHCQRV